MMFRLLDDQMTHCTDTIYHVTGKVSNGKEPTTFTAILSYGKNLTNLALFQQSWTGNYLTFSNWNVSHTSSLSSTLLMIAFCF